MQTMKPVQPTTGRGGLPCLRIATPLAEAEIYLHGAHVTHFQPHGQRPVLFMSEKSSFEPGKPIRGGVPICFPWFGARGEGLPGTAHGFARLETWQLTGSTMHASGEVELSFQLAPHGEARHGWSHDVTVSYLVRIGTALQLTLEVRNNSDSPVAFDEALHTYLAVSNIHTVTLEGLAGTPFLDRLTPDRECAEPVEPLRFTAETDRIYLNTRAPCTVHDPEWKRRLIVEKQHSLNTVVWNPWIAKSAAMPDFGDHEWPGMLCVETCNIRAHQITLPPGQTHAMTAIIRAEPLD